jgi:glutamyl-tRNA reductase
MHALVVGLNYNTASVEVREKLALGSWQLKEALVSLFDHVPEGIILSTCNRTEVYTLADEHYSETTRVEDFLSELGNMSISELSPYLYAFQQEMAVRHLFRIASGLESLILGEFEVLGQVREALQDAESTGLVSLPLLNLFRQAVRVGRRARTETGISRNPVSVSSVAIDLAKKTFDDLSKCKVLVISAGEAGKLAVKTLVKHGISHLMVTSRSYEKALALASAHGGEAVPFHHLKEPLAEADILISSSGAPHFILEPTVVAEAMRSRPHRPLVLIDIAVPRDIDPRVKDIENVCLYDIDDLEAVSGSHHRQRAKEKEKVMTIIDAEVAKFISWWHSQEAVPTITALVSKAERIRRTQLARTLGRMQMSDEERAAIDAMTQAIVKRILHDPIRSLRNGEQGDNHIQAVQELFDLDTKA